jgi:hypothetical protein
MAAVLVVAVPLLTGGLTAAFTAIKTTPDAA